jgi:proteasome beta subunit
MEDKNHLKTGTTTVALVCKDGIVLAADKRVTAGYQIQNKGFEKVYPISETMAVTVAGSVSDIQLFIKYIKAEIKLKALRTQREVSVREAVNLLAMFLYNGIRMQGSIAHFIVGGKDSTGFHAYDLGPDGSIMPIEDYMASGSGSVYAIGTLEATYKPNMTIDEATKVAVKAINSAVQRDIASGNGVDVMTITKDGLKKAYSQVLSYKVEVQ